MNNNRLAVYCKSSVNEYACHNRPLRLVSLAGSFVIRNLVRSGRMKMNIARLFRALALIAATLMMTCVLLAQTDRGSIEGTVKDPNGGVVPAAKVQVVNIETNSKLDYQSD